MATSWKKLKAAVKFTGLAKRGNKETSAAAAHCSADDVDIILEHLLDTQGKKKMRLKERKVAQLINHARTVIMQEPMLLEVAPPVNICGDLHGQFSDAVRVFDICKLPGGNNKYLFLGDYVDRGQMGLETITLLLALKVKFPKHIFLLRGNHECASINRVYGFFDECKRRYSVKLWKTFSSLFDCLPAAAVVGDSIFCMHGGLSPELNDLDAIRQLQRPQDVPEHGLFADLLWSDPNRHGNGWEENDRGVSFTFGADVVQRFLQRHNLELICRAHQVVEDGYEFFANRRLVTLFTAPNYCGQFINAGAIMTVSASLQCSFKILRDSLAMRPCPPAEMPPTRPTPGFFDDKMAPAPAGDATRESDASKRATTSSPSAATAAPAAAATPSPSVSASTSAASAASASSDASPSSAAEPPPPPAAARPKLTATVSGDDTAGLASPIPDANLAMAGSTPGPMRGSGSSSPIMEDYVDQQMQQAQAQSSSGAGAFAGATPMVDQSILGAVSNADQ